MAKKAILYSFLILTSIPHIVGFDWITVDKNTTQVNATYSDGTVHKFRVKRSELNDEEKLTDKLLQQIIDKRRETWK